MEKLPTRIVDKPWGRTNIDPMFGADPERKVGEIWFEPPQGLELGVMAKYLFTSERLSVQVHPDDKVARSRGHTNGKDECWLILDTEPGAELGIGTIRPVGDEELMKAALDGSIVDLVDWRHPKTGDFFYNPAHTVHALGAGLTVLEIQQPIDLTYRLYDYGRPRELHLDRVQGSVHARPHHDPRDGPVGAMTRMLVDSGPFAVAWCVGTPPPVPGGLDRIQLLPIDAPVADVTPGECALLTSEEASALRSDGRFVLAWPRPI